MLARFPDVAHSREASDEMVDARLPRFDVLGHHDDECPCLLNDRRKQDGKQGKQRGRRPDYRKEEGELRWDVQLLDEKISHRTEVQRDDYRYEEQEKNVGGRSQHPEEQERQDYAGDNRRYSDPRGRRASQGYFFSSWISSTSMSSSSCCRPALSALLFAAAAGRTPIFCLSAMSCISAEMSAPPASSFLKSLASLSPENSSSISAFAFTLRSLLSIFSSIRANASNADFSEMCDIVSLMRFCASVRRCFASRRFFLRFASSMLSFRLRSESLRRSVSCLCACHVSCICSPREMCSVRRIRACLSSSSWFCWTASIALRSQSSASFSSCFV